MKDIELILGDALVWLEKIPENTVDLVLTDPPYFLDKLDDKWSHEEVLRAKSSVGTVKYLPVGMKFSPEQAVEFGKWFSSVAYKVFRILKPGGWFLSFSHPRLFHRLVCSTEDAGFWIRDIFLWIYTQNQPKAFSLEHFLDRTAFPPEVKEKLREELRAYKVPKVKSNYEPIMVAQKPPEGTLLENFAKYGVGLFNVKIKQGKGMFPSNIITTDSIDEVMDRYFLIEKPDRKEKGAFNDHPSVKPIKLLRFLIELTTKEKALVVDPFMGSGSTAVACKETGRRFIGIEINKHYYEIATRRLKEKVSLFE